MNGMRDAGSYEEYRASVQAQAMRDKDRFTGVDSHSEEPMYAADNGMPPTLSDFVAAGDALSTWFVEVFQPVVQKAVRDLTLLWAEWETRLRTTLAEDGGHRAISRHSYPRPHREWWNRR